MNPNPQTSRQPEQQKDQPNTRPQNPDAGKPSYGQQEKPGFEQGKKQPTSQNAEAEEKDDTNT